MISVIIPAYNYARFLPGALESLLHQSFTDWECIIVNNGSFDETEDVVKVFLQKDNRFKYFSIENKGVSNSRNYALQKSSGEFIQFLDADDLLEKEKLNTHFYFLQHSPETDLVYGDASYFSSGNPAERKQSMHEYDKDWMPRNSGKGTTLLNTLVRRNIFPINAPLFRKSLIEKFGAFDELLAGLEDWDLWLRFAANGAEFKYLKGDETNALIRVHQGSASQNKKMMHRHIFPVLQRYLFHRGTSFNQKLYLFMRYQEELLDTVFKMFTGKFEKITSSKSNSVFSFRLLLCAGILFVPLYLAIKTYRKFFN